MNPQPTLRLTRHASHRRLERDVPASVLDELCTTAKDFLGHHACHRRIWYRVVRLADTFWIAPHKGGEIITIYAKHRSELRRWAATYLVNPDESSHRLGLLANHRTAEEAVTDELARLWGAVEA